MKFTSRVAAVGLIGALMLATPVAAQAALSSRAVPDHSSVVPSHAGSSSDTAAVLSPQDRTFLVKAHESNLAEITGGWLALVKGGCAAVRRIAQVLIEHHSRLDADIRALADRFGVWLPNALSAEHATQLAVVSVLPGRAFDIAWLGLQVRWHHEALELGRQELILGRSTEVKAAAREAAPVIKHHLRLIGEAEEQC